MTASLRPVSVRAARRSPKGSMLLRLLATGAVLLPFKFFNWIGTVWKGQLTLKTSMLFSIGFLVTFLLRLSVLPFSYSVVRGYRYGRPAGADDPVKGREVRRRPPPPRPSELVSHGTAEPGH